MLFFCILVVVVIAINCFKKRNICWVVRVVNYFFYSFFHCVNPQRPHAYLSPWSAMNMPCPHRSHTGFFLSILPSFTSYNSYFLDIRTIPFSVVFLIRPRILLLQLLLQLPLGLLLLQVLRFLLLLLWFLFGLIFLWSRILLLDPLLLLLHS